MGGQLNAFQLALEATPPVSIRLNPVKPINDFENMERVLWHPQGRYMPERPIFTVDPLFHAGTYYVQEASSMAIYQALHQVVDLNQKLKVLDFCAAPGGKSTLLASAISPSSFLLANEAIKSRIEPLRQNLLKWGNSNYMVSNHDPADFSGLDGFFDVVLVDAPCSGEGLFRKDSKAVNEWSLENVALCAARQKRILASAKKLVKNGGILIYSTCTYNDRENDQNIEWILNEGFFENIKLSLPEGWGIKETTFGYQFYPHFVKGEGFYMSILKKNGSNEKIFTNKKLKNGWTYLSKKEKAIVDPWIENPQQLSFFKKPNNEIVAVPIDLESIFIKTAASLKRRSFGTLIGAIKNKKLIPAHGFALSNIIKKEMDAIEPDVVSALQFLRKDNFEINSKRKGWNLIRHKGHNLGWVKLLGNRFNNYFPNEWRIRRY